MSITQIFPGLWQFKLDFVNAFLIDPGEEGEGLILVDTGLRSHALDIAKAITVLGKKPNEVSRIVVTHAHSDHSGGLAELKRLTRAATIMHSADAELVRKGDSLRPLKPAPGVVNFLVTKLLLPRTPIEIEPAEISREAKDGDMLPGDISVIHVPGHCAGQIALLWPHPKHGGVLFAADACANVFGLAPSPMYEDYELGRQSLARLATFDFQIACFGHGKPILSRASDAFRRKFGDR